MSTIKNASTLHANHAVVKMNGKQVGRLQSLSANRDSSADYVYEVGSPDPVEINHNRRSYRLTAASLILRKNLGSAVVNNFAAGKLGDVAAFSVEFIDRDNGTAWVAEGVEPTGDSINVPLNQRVSQNVQFMALNIRPANAKSSSSNFRAPDRGGPNEQGGR